MNVYFSERHTKVYMSLRYSCPFKVNEDKIRRMDFGTVQFPHKSFLGKSNRYLFLYTLAIRKRKLRIF